MSSLSILNLATAIMGFIVSGMLIFSTGQNRFVNRFLGIGFFTLAYRSLSLFALQNHLVDNTFLMGSVSYVYYLMPVTFYLYFRSMIMDEQSFRKSDWKHLLIPVFAVLLLLYYLIRGLIISGHIELPGKQNIFNELKEFPLHILPKYHIMAMFALCIIYISWSWNIFIQKLKFRPGEHPQVKKIRVWVLTLLITCTLLVGVVLYNALLVVVLKMDVKYVLKPDIMRAIILFFIFTRVLFKPDLLFGIPTIQTNLPVIDEVPTHSFQEPETPVVLSPIESTIEQTSDIKEETNQTYTKEDDQLYFDAFGWIHQHALENEANNLTEATAPIEKDKVVYYINRITEYILTEPYTDPDFDMKNISKELQFPLYHIEYLFRYYNRYSFSEFRNILRVQYVLKDFDLGLSQNYTMEAIGERAGFSSRSSFFRVFKTITGKTPKQLLEEMDSKN